MRGSFFWRNRIALTSGLLLLFSAHLISTGVRPEGLAGRPAAVLMEILRPMQLATTRMARGATALIGDYFFLVGVRRENARLREELARLGTERVRLAELELENRRLAELLELKDALGLKAVAATVIGSDATGLARTLVLGQGRNRGLKPGMAVLCNQGVVGKLISASPDAARVLLIDDHNSALDAFDQRSRARGIVAGQLEGGLTMKYVERKEDVARGDAVITSGLDGIFPRGLLIGRVSRVVRQGPGLFINVEVAPAVDFRLLEQVLVVTQQPPRITVESKS